MKGIVVRGNTIHIQATRDKKRVRFSVGLKATKQNIEFVSKNCHNFIDDYLEKCGKEKLRKVAQKDDKATFAHYLSRIMKMAGGLKVNTQKTYASYNNLLLDFFADKKVWEIDRENIEDFYMHLHKNNFSASRARSVVNFARRAFDLAVHDDEIIKNPIFTYKFSSFKGKKEIQPFSLEDVQQILQESKKDLYPKYFYNLLCVAFFTGMRSGELFALKYENLDFLRNKIKVCVSINAKGDENAPKTKSSLREIDMLPPVRGALENQLKIESGKYLFSGEKPFKNAQIFKKHWKALLANCGLKYRVFYNTRHTFASIMISEGEEQMWVSKMLGHQNLAITLSHYARFIENKEKERARFLKNLQF